MLRSTDRRRAALVLLGLVAMGTTFDGSVASAQMGHMDQPGYHGQMMGGGTMMMGRDRTSPGGSASGKQLYIGDCSSCHRASGAGGLKIGEATSADLRAPALEVMYRHDDRLLLRAILSGVDEDGEALDQAMPRWQGTLSKQQANAIVSYLKQLHK
ncbi:c-type cytochrome [Acidimangrovimonas sediminis]|uniref:c-type cytochrome n=1 Tax=Acidimangrovimonas sediminis TaxID=2056283 RepID=UPI0018ECC80B|nr:cytochrome c [Acidimangrovimonas sediminis]